MKNERREEYEATLLRRIEQIEALSMLIPDVTMLCPICSKYSVISFEYHTSLSSADLHSCTQLPPATEGEYFSRLVDMYGRRLSRPLRKLCMHDSLSLFLSLGHSALVISLTRLAWRRSRECAGCPHDEDEDCD